MRQPKAPTQKEIDEHLPTHLPYREWCPQCVAGQATGIQHRSKDKNEEEIGITICMDYCFMTPVEDAEGDQEPVLVMYDSRTKATWCMMADHKGALPWIVKWCVAKLEEAGYNGKDITIKTDGEPALMDLKRAIMASRVGITTPIESPVRQSKSNGAMERAIRTWQGYLRTIKKYFEDKCKIKLDIKHELFQWMVMWSSESLNFFKVHASGKTTHEMITGHKMKRKVPGFGEKVMFRMAPEKKRYKSETEWDQGLFVGVIARSTEYVLMNEEGIFKTENIKRFAAGNEYDETCLEWAKTPIDDFVNKGALTRARTMTRLPEEVRADPEAIPYAPRRVRFVRKDFEKHEFTEGCPECIRLQTGLGSRKVHSEPCRSRMVEAFERDPEDRARVRRAQARADGWSELRDHGEEDDAGEEPHQDQVPDDGMNVDDEPTTRNTTSESTSDSSSDSESDSQKTVDLEMQELDVALLSMKQYEMNEVDRRIIASVLQGKDLTEVYSPERVVQACKKYDLRPGRSMDIRNGYNFDLAADRKRAIEQIKEDEPTVVIGSPPCTMFSALQQLAIAVNKSKPGWMEEWQLRLDQARRHIKFCCHLYDLQLKAGRYFLHEHPWSAKSWYLPEIAEMMNRPGVTVTKGHMCRFGMTACNEEGELQPVKKPTGFMTNSWCIADELNRLCLGDHRHTQLMNGKAAAAAVYPKELCEAICRGLRKQKECDSRGSICSMAMSIKQLEQIRRAGNNELNIINKENIDGGSEHWKDNKHEQDGHGRNSNNFEGEELLRDHLSALYHNSEGLTARDDVSQQELDPSEVLKARQLEMAYFDSMKVYTKVPRSHQEKTGGKIIRTRWIDVNKGDSERRDYRSRLVGKEFKQKAENELFASTPPLEALRTVVNHAATWDAKQPHRRRRIMVNDVKRAYFNARATRDLYIELPEEDVDHGKNLIGKLNLCLYGTRDAAVNWQEALSENLLKAGFVRGIGHTAVFYHPTRDVMVMVHGDDYVSSGWEEDLQWLKTILEADYEIKTQLIGPVDHAAGQGEIAEGKVLNRVIRATTDGWQIEADPRHAELIAEQMGVQNGKGVVTPGNDEESNTEGEEDKLLEGQDVTLFRGIAARANYLSADRPDLQYAAKELCRDMAAPNGRSLAKMKRLARYLVMRPRLIWHMKMQNETDIIDVYADANWAGCKETRRSTSGGCIRIGEHTIKSWSKTQATVAKSSAESELYGIVKASCEGLGVATLLRDLGKTMKVRVHVDASAAIGIVERKGINKVRHLEVDVLWLQEAQARRILPLQKIAGEKNPADLMTKHVGAALAQEHLERLSLEFRDGRAEVAAKLYIITDKDQWRERGEAGRWTRQHNEWRRTLFTPHKVPEGPGKNNKSLGAIRKTIGVYKDGQKFEVEDCWMSPANAHRPLRMPWRGMTTFAGAPR